MNDHKELMVKAVDITSASLLIIADALDGMKPGEINKELARVIGDELQKAFFAGYAEWQRESYNRPQFGGN